MGVLVVPSRLAVTRVRAIPKRTLLQLTFKAIFTLPARHAPRIRSERVTTYYH